MLGMICWVSSALQRPEVSDRVDKPTLRACTETFRAVGPTASITERSPYARNTASVSRTRTLRSAEQEDSGLPHIPGGQSGLVDPCRGAVWRTDTMHRSSVRTMAPSTFTFFLSASTVYVAERFCRGRR